MSNKFPADFIFSVILLSDSLGLVLPEGWLWQIIVPQAFALIAAW
jgi:hypothetical protein